MLNFMIYCVGGVVREASQYPASYISWLAQWRRLHRTILSSVLPVLLLAWLVQEHSIVVSRSVSWHDLFYNFDLAGAHIL